MKYIDSKALLLATLLPASVLGRGVSDQKNVIFILTDDQGYGDMEFTGNTNIKTPVVNSWAERGFCFTDYHSGTCSAPARAALMTGKYCDEVGVWGTVRGRSILREGDVALPQIFQQNGYATAMYGKWHLGDNYPFRPMDRGFDETLWLKGGGLTQTPDYWDNDYFDDVYFRGAEPERQKGYCTDVFFDNAIDFIEDNKEKPFFIYLALNAPHGPFHVDEKWVKPYRGNPHIPVPEFYGMIANIDHNMGLLEQRLKELGLDENTILIFSTDNGSAGGLELDKAHHVTNGYNAGMRGKKSDAYEGGHRTPMIICMPENKKHKDIDQLAASVDFAPTLIDLCSLKSSAQSDMAGYNLVPTMYGDQRIDRYVVMDHQKGELMERKNKSVVMKEKWRLVNDKELYDVSTDIGQINDLAAKYPEKVAEMLAIHDEWWAKHIEPSQSQFSYISVPEYGSDRVVMNCHDMHYEGQHPCPWLQTYIREGMRPQLGFWSIDVEQAGKYSVRVYRWAPESGLDLTGIAPAGGPIPNGISYPEGVAIKDITGAKVNVGGEEYVETPKSLDGKKYIEIQDVMFKEGNQKLSVLMLSDSGEFGAYYVELIKN